MRSGCNYKRICLACHGLFVIEGDWPEAGFVIFDVYTDEDGEAYTSIDGNICSLACLELFHKQEK